MKGWAPDKEMQKKMLEWESSGEMPKVDMESTQKEVDQVVKKQVNEQLQKKEQMSARERLNSTIQKVREYKERMKMKRRRRGRAMAGAMGSMKVFGGNGPTLIGGKRFEGGSTSKG